GAGDRRRRARAWQAGRRRAPEAAAVARRAVAQRAHPRRVRRRRALSGPSARRSSAPFVSAVLSGRERALRCAATPMRITYPAQTAALPRSSQLLVVARAKAFAAADCAAALRRLLGGEAAAAALALAGRTTPGLLGSTASTLLAARSDHARQDGARQDGARQIAVGVIANAVAAHNCHARTDAVRRVVAAWAGSAPLGGDVLLLLEDRAHLLPAVNAVARALPSFTRKTSPRRRREGSVAVHCSDESGRPLLVPDRTAA